MSIAEGSCLCGTVKYAVHAHPTRVTMCHCKFCQRATGGAYLVEPIFENTDFEILYGNTKIYEHVSEGSGKLVYVHFCERCGRSDVQLYVRSCNHMDRDHEYYCADCVKGEIKKDTAEQALLIAAGERDAKASFKALNGDVE